MKTILVFEYEWKEKDGIGTSNDAMFCAVDNLINRISWADSSDDIAAIFKEIKHKI